MKNVTDKEAFINENGFYISTPHGSSMWPFIRGGRDTAVFRPVNKKPGRFDAVLYKRKNGEHVLHRIVRKTKNGYFVRGDNCFYTERVDERQLIGLMTNLFRSGNREKDLLSFRSYRVGVRLWVMVYPFRFCVHMVFSAFGRCFRAFEKRQKNRS